MAHATPTHSSEEAGENYGDYVESTDEFEIENECEPGHRHRDTYYPVCIGEVMNDRYQIIHKLGWGGFSTVWLARDLETGTAVALKVLPPENHGTQEVAIAQIIKEKALQKSHVNLLIHQDLFRLPGQQGTQHLVLVLPVMGPSLDDFTTCRLLPPKHRIRAVRPLLLALQSLHSAGIIHRDLNYGAVMWELEPISHMTTAELHARFGRPRKMKLDFFDLPLWKQGEFVEAITFPRQAGTVVDEPIQRPIMYCAPERYHGYQPSFAGDMWTYTLLFAMLYVGVDSVFGGGSMAVDRLIALLGAFPTGWKEKYSVTQEAAKDHWYNSAIPIQPRLETLGARMDRLRPEIGREERAHALSLIRRGLAYDPEERLTATQMLEDPSFKAIMEIYEG